MNKLLSYEDLDEDQKEYLQSAIEDDDEVDIDEILEGFIEDEQKRKDLVTELVMEREEKSKSAGKNDAKQSKTAVEQRPIVIAAFATADTKKEEQSQQKQQEQEQEQKQKQQYSTGGGKSRHQKKHSRKYASNQNEDDNAAATTSSSSSSTSTTTTATSSSIIQTNSSKSSAVEDVAVAIVGRDHQSQALLSHSKEINVRGLRMVVGEQKTELLNNAWLKLLPGHIYALIGRNGVGKTTLMRYMASRSIIGFPSSVRTLLVEQEAKASKETAIEAVLHAASVQTDELEAELRALEEAEGEVTEEVAERMATLASAIDEASNQLEDGLSIARATKLLRGLGFSKALMNTAIEKLSGGWRMRVALACALYVGADLLLLDEPTNFLDLPAISWLQNYLASDVTKDMIVVVTSHDRAFLDAVATDVVAFANKQLRYANGNYSAYEYQANERMLSKQREEAQNEKTRKNLEQQLQRLKQQASKSKRDGTNRGMIANRKKKLERVGEFTNVRDLPMAWRTARRDFLMWGETGATALAMDYASDEALVSTINERFEFPSPPSLGATGDEATWLALDDVAFRYSESSPLLFEHITLVLDRRSRVVILGPNGVGKSTLLRVAAGELTPTAGERRLHHGVRVGYFAQHSIQELPLHQSAMNYLHDYFSHSNNDDYSDDQLRAALGQLGIRGDLALQAMQKLSGGEKTRVVFARIVLSNPSVLILDECTSHLDLPTIDVIVNAVSNFNGAVLFVTHDVYFVSSLQPRELFVPTTNGISRYEGTIENYLEAL